MDDIYELTYVCKNGSRLPARVSVTALRGPSDDVVGYLLIGNDDSKRKALEEKLAKSMILQTAIQSSTSFSQIATDAQGVIQLFSSGAESMLGFKAADVLGKMTPAELSDPQELIVRAKYLSEELGQNIKPGFEALVVKAVRAKYYSTIVLHAQSRAYFIV